MILSYLFTGQSPKLQEFSTLPQQKSVKKLWNLLGLKQTLFRTDQGKKIFYLLSNYID